MKDLCIRLALLITIIVITESCTMTVNLVNASGEASDVVDEAAKTSAQVDANW